MGKNRYRYKQRCMDPEIFDMGIQTCLCLSARRMLQTRALGKFWKSKFCETPFPAVFWVWNGLPGPLGPVLPLDPSLTRKGQKLLKDYTFQCSANVTLTRKGQRLLKQSRNLFSASWSSLPVSSHFFRFMAPYFDPFFPSPFSLALPLIK
jgi:hypothetical protein